MNFCFKLTYECFMLQTDTFVSYVFQDFQNVCSDISKSKKLFSIKLMDNEYHNMIFIIHKRSEE